MERRTGSNEPTPSGLPTPTIAGWMGGAVVLLALLPVGFRALDEPDWQSLPRLATFAGLLLGYGLADRAACRSTTRTGLVLALVACTALGLAAVWTLPMAYPGAAVTAALLVVTAGRTHRLSTPSAYAWIAVQSLGLLVLFTHRWGSGSGITAALAFLALQLLVHWNHRLAASERAARTDLSATLEHLRATRSELASTSRRLERHQIAADLHDVLGHHLVALRLQLEAARAAADDRHLDQARDLARLLLAEVRNVVDELQDTQDFDFATNLRTLAETDTRPTVSVEAEPTSPEPRVGRELFRVVQEAVTNARKHAAAEAITVRWNGRQLEIRDDGRSWNGPLAGRGLDGMAARCAEQGVDLQIHRRSGEGTRVVLTLPESRPGDSA